LQDCFCPAGKRLHTVNPIKPNFIVVFSMIRGKKKERKLFLFIACCLLNESEEIKE
jgi:hypothetical protein